MSLRLKQTLVKAKGMVYMSSPMNIKEHLDIGHQTVRNENDEDAKAAARAIDLYKADKKMATKPSSNKEAAMGIKTRSGSSAPSADGQDGVFYESQVAKMNANEYERHQEDIAKSIRSGKFVYDLSGSAR